jgi:translation initiation factor IF-3
MVHLFFYVNLGSKIGGVIISDVLINEQIRFKEVRVLGENGEQLGVMPIKEAQKLSDDAGVDLILIAPKAEPPVCRIMDYGKFKYEQSRRDKEAKKKQKVTEVKEVRLSPNIDTNDLNTKVNMARKFLTHGDKVKVTLRFKGRELAHVNTSKSILDDFAEALSDVAVIEKPAKFEGRSMIMFLTEKR